MAFIYFSLKCMWCWFFLSAGEHCVR